MSRVLGAAILGTGDVTGGHIRAYQTNAHTEVRAILSRDRERAEAKAREYGLANCRAYTCLDELLKQDDIDVVSVCTPHHLHVEQAVACAQAGKHVVVEKPVALDLASPRKLDRITSAPSKRSGMFDQFSYGYLGFTLGPDGHTIYYLTGGPIYVDGKRVKGKDSTGKGESKGVEDLHLVTRDILTSRYTGHGAIYPPNGDRPAYVNSIAVGKDGTVYTLSRVTENGVTRADLISVKP
jgi:hypothetical protein